MFNPKYRILLTNKCFPKDEVIGLGSQLISIIHSIKKFLLPHVWYGADIDAVGKGAKKRALKAITPILIGTELELIEYCNEIEQFIWGVFLCVEKSFVSQNVQNIGLETEDEPFRSIDINGVLIEIRAFDTSCFELYTDNLELIMNISKLYSVSFQEK